MKVRYFTPLFGFLTIACIAWLLVVPHGVTTGFNTLAAGFGVAVAGAVVAYTAGIRMVARCSQCHSYMARAAAHRQQPAARTRDVATKVRAFAAKLKYFMPLVAFVGPSLLIGYGVVIPNSRIEGITAFTIGYGAMIAAACIAYLLGLWTVVTDGAPAAA